MAQTVANRKKLRVVKTPRPKASPPRPLARPRAGLDDGAISKSGGVETQTRSGPPDSVAKESPGWRSATRSSSQRAAGVAPGPLTSSEDYWFPTGRELFEDHAPIGSVSPSHRPHGGRDQQALVLAFGIAIAVGIAVYLWLYFSYGGR